MEGRQDMECMRRLECLKNLCNVRRMYAIDGLHIEYVRNLENAWNSNRIHGILGMCMDFKECVKCVKNFYNA